MGGWNRRCSINARNEEEPLALPWREEGEDVILLNPGPVNVSERVRQALLRPDICHRESEFTELLLRIQGKLLKAFVPVAEADYAAVLITGSGTAAVESALMSAIPHGKRVLVLNNGVYGERLSQMVGLHRLGVSELKYEWTTRPDPERLRLALRQHPEVHAVAMVHHETTTGLINPVKEIADVVDSQNRVFILDAVSGLGGETIDVAGSHIYMVAGTAGKCIQGFPGVSFVLVRKGFLERMRQYPKRSWYLHLTHYVDDQGRGTIPFTPAVQVFYGFDEALSELLEEGVANRIQRYKKASTLIRARMAKLGIKPMLTPERQSNTITAYSLPDGVTYDQLHDRLKAQGYVIYAGQGQLESKIFRVANMGALTEAQLTGFLDAFEQACKPA
ncbi:MAG: alanine--glyoxylate aminotransferase family protein [Nitrospirota bacterium]